MTRAAFAVATIAVFVASLSPIVESTEEINEFLVAYLEEGSEEPIDCMVLMVPVFCLEHGLTRSGLVTVDSTTGTNNWYNQRANDDGTITLSCGQYDAGGLDATCQIQFVEPTHAKTLLLYACQRCSNFEWTTGAVKVFLLPGAAPYLSRTYRQGVHQDYDNYNVTQPLGTWRHATGAHGASTNDASCGGAPTNGFWGGGVRFCPSENQDECGGEGSETPSVPAGTTIVWNDGTQVEFE